MGFPMWTLATVDFGIQWIVWAFSAYFATERFYDLTGSLTFLLVTFLSLRLGIGGSNGGGGGIRGCFYSETAAFYVGL